MADQHSLKIYLKDHNIQYNLHEGWNILYITDLFKPVPFFVRGNEFTSQLYNFIGCIESKDEKNLCSFNEASKTLDVIESIFMDYNNNGKLLN